MSNNDNYDFEHQQVMMGQHVWEVHRGQSRETGFDSEPNERPSHRTEPQSETGSDINIPLPDDTTKAFESIMSEEDILERASIVMLAATIVTSVACTVGIGLLMVREIWRNK